MADPTAKLEKLSIFGALDPQAIRLVESKLVVRRFPEGAVIIRQGDQPDGLYVIISGLVQVRVDFGAGEQVVAELGDGAVFGEMAVIDIMPRAATIAAVVPVEAYFLARQDFFSLCADSSQTFAIVALNLARELSRRLRCADFMLAQAGLMHEDESAKKARLRLGIGFPGGP